MFTKFVALALAVSMWAAGVVAGSAVRVIDGDTVEINGQVFRIHGIDAPEFGQMCRSPGGGEWACGEVAGNALRSMASQGDMTCAPREKDIYGRWIAVCLVNGNDVGHTMVEMGLAWAFRKYSDTYASVEEAARERRVGIWQADTVTAWDYRSRRWSAATQDAPRAECPIKGNINQKLERIYHAPWSRDYSRTKIDTRRGERWFCSEAEALAAGWRAPQAGK